MFTGIIEAIGKIKTMQTSDKGARMTIDCGQLDMTDVKLGDSIATNGVCLTVVAFDNNSFTADVSLETLQRSGLSLYQIGDGVNLEKAMLPTTRFGGHIVSGHVDGVSNIVSIAANGNSVDYWINMPDNLAPYIAEKGSITIDGISLTVNSVSDNAFRLTIVPHTMEKTIMSDYWVGRQINLEVDVMARYVERLLHKKTSQSTEKSGVTHEQLVKAGFTK